MWVLLILLILVFVVVRLLGKSESIGHWSHLFADMEHDPEDFYNLVEETLKRWQVPDYKTHRRTFSEGK